MMNVFIITCPTWGVKLYHFTNREKNMQKNLIFCILEKGAGFMRKKIVFLDVDGTLTSGSREISRRVSKGICKARQNGHYIFLCTGRNRAGVQQFQNIGFDGMICCAGGYIEIQGKVIYEACLEDKDVKEARNIFDRNHIMYNLEATHVTFQDDDMHKAFIGQHMEGKIINSELERLINEEKDRFKILPVDNYDKNPIPIQKICFMAQHEKDLKEPRELLSQKYNFIVHELYSKNFINGEIILKERNKGTAIQKVVNYLHMSMEDTIGFGDSMNDYEMIQTCACGIVMENGSEELKKYATNICESVDNDGVYFGMERLGLLI